MSAEAGRVASWQNYTCEIEDGIIPGIPQKLNGVPSVHQISPIKPVAFHDFAISHLPAQLLLL